MKFNQNKLILSIFFALGLVACSPSETSEEYLRLAKININDRQNVDAIIALKNAVNLDPKNAEARFLLGSLYLSVGNAVAAEKELTHAIVLSDDVSSVIPKLLKALHLQNKSNETIALIAGVKEMTPEILIYQALAYSRIGEKEKTKQSIAQANELSTESAYSQLGEAYLKADSLNMNDALSMLKSLLEQTPDLTEALLLQGQLLVLQKNYAAAIIAFERYFQLLPADIKIRLYLASAYVKNKQFDEAEEHIDFLLKKVPEHAFSNQLKGLVYYQREDYIQALMHTEKSIQNGMNTSSNRIVAGLSAFKLKEYERAHQFLIAVTDNLPNNHPARRVLASVQMQLGYSVDAGKTLSQFDGDSSIDVDLFTSASFELMKLGKIDEAKLLLSKVDYLISDNAEAMTKVGILRLSMNNLDGLTDLEKAAEISPDSLIAKIALAGAYIQNKEFDKALALGKKWKEAQPEQVEGYNLVAKVLLMQEKTAAAEAELKRALVIKENNTLSLLYFAAKALTANEFEEAISLLDIILKTKPHNIKALALYYRANRAINNEAVAINKIASSFIESEQKTANRLLYAKVLFIENSFEKVIELLNNLGDSETVSGLHWMLLSDSYWNTAQSTKALAVIDHWIEVKPEYRAAWLRKMSIQEELADFRGALSTVELVLDLAPKDEQFNVLRGYYLIRTKQFHRAQIQINSLPNNLKNTAFVQGLQGQIWLTEGKYAQALLGLKTLYKKLPTPYNTALLFATLIELKQNKNAFDFLVKHVTANPNDFITRALLAEKAVTFDQNLAKKHYLILLKNDPNDLSVLNNLAWVEYKLTNYNDADKLSIRALKLNNNNPHVLDTAGLIKLQLGDKAEAISLLKKAHQLAPADKLIEQHYKDAVNSR
jgi:putative PEP-CTERM system TPR-repeat lipoprotein